MKKVFIKTFGCQANFYDSRRIEDIFISNGYELSTAMSEADIIVINSCHVREKTGEKIFSELGRIGSIKNKKISEGKYVAVIVVGCVASALGENIFMRSPVVDLVLGSGSYHRIGDMVSKIFSDFEWSSGRRSMDLSFNKEKKFAQLPKERSRVAICESVVIQDGCDKFCSYCTVPFTRGREYSRPVEDIMAEIRYLVGHGSREIILLGQNVNSYSGLNGKNKHSTLAELIYLVNEVDGVDRIRYLTNYPSQFGDDLIIAHRELDKLMPLIYIPVQSGSNGILKSMNRKYSREQYIDLISKIRKNVKNVAFSSDFIVGFPGETEEDFMATVDLAEIINYGLAFSFKYSPRPDTSSATMENQIPEKIKSSRLNRLQTILNQQQIEFNRSYLAKEVEILIENESKENSSLFFGRTPHFQPTMVRSDKKKLANGEIVRVKINGAGLRTLEGDVIAETSK
ncbi:MAG: tRNA (N6-isopentenyl adenosine(37)-C2)-methylthiotransferase MiaB, partial [Rickettsiales bacterium]|nr:tRNA (N6-isopentenyl adenosine(37)-C2)-methylthiotransferase MiaB [Rickettsiales bacterium]